MPEAHETNIEVAHTLFEKKEKKGPRSSRLEFDIELLEAIILALVAIAAAYSGYQAALWGGHQAKLYAESDSIEAAADTLIVTEREDFLFNSNLLNAWVNAKMQGNETIAHAYESRFLPEYKVAFDAWVKLDPFNNSEAPRGPRYMPEYRSSRLEQANNLTAESLSKFSEGTEARSIGDSYVRATVFLATVLVVIAISQRFEIKSIRTGLTIVSLLLLLIGIASLFTLPRMV